MNQIELFNWINPLKIRFKEEKWLEIPQKSGVYRFYDAENKLLYVGKSKQLKKRIKSYMSINPIRHGKRMVELVQKIANLEWEETPTEKDALLLENKWLREKKPTFNRANTHPETHLFIGIKKVNEKLYFG